MKVHTVVVASLVGMLSSSGLAWALSSADAPSSPSATQVVSTQPATVPAVARPATAAQRDAPELPRAVAQTEFDADGTVRMRARVGHATLERDRPGETFLYVALTAQPKSAARAESFGHITLVVDRSGSMRGRRMDTALTAARNMVSRMRDGDLVSVVSYDGRAQIEVAPVQLDTRTRPRVLAAIGRITPSGNTCLSCGVQLGLEMGRRSTAGMHRVLLLSDGKANRGEQTAAGFLRFGSPIGAVQTPITSVGIGVDYDERLLSSLSRATNGGHHFVERLAQMQPVLEHELDQLNQTVATSAEIEVALASGVELLEVLDRSATRQGNRMRVPLGSFAVGEDKTLLLRVRLPPGAGPTAPVGQITLSYLDRASGRRLQASGTLEVNMAAAQSQLGPEVAARVAQSETVREIREINAFIDAGRDDEARAAVDRGRRRIARRRKVVADAQPGAPIDAATRASFGRQATALDRAADNATLAQQAGPRQSAGPPAAARKAASKRNIELSHPFD